MTGGGLANIRGLLDNLQINGNSFCFLSDRTLPNLHLSYCNGGRVNAEIQRLERIDSFNWRGNLPNKDMVRVLSQRHCSKSRNPQPRPSPSALITVAPVIARRQIMTPAKKTTSTADVGEKKKEYKYQQEISQMVRSQRRQAPVFPN